MKLLYIFLTAILLSPFYALSQSNYKPGVITTKNGQTINGFINYREWLSNPEKISFKEKLTADATTYGPQELSYFEVTGFESYQTATVSISKAKNDIQNMSDEIDTSSYTATVFLKLLQKGNNVSLFSYTDDVKTRYYVSDRDITAPRELKYQAYYDHDLQSVKKKNTYYAQLIDLANKYKGNNAQDLINSIVTLDYKERDLLKIINRLNNQDVNNRLNTAVAAPGYRFFAGIGANISTTSRADDLPAGTYDVSKQYIMPELMLGVSTPFNPNTGKLVFRTELGLLLSKARIDNHADSYTANKVYSTAYSEITVSLRPQVVYNFYNADSFKFYSGAGLAINLSRYYDITYTTTTSSTVVAGYNGTEKLTVPPATSTWFTPMLRAGFVLNNKVDISMAYHVKLKSTYAANLLYVNKSLTEIGVNYIF